MPDLDEAYELRLLAEVARWDDQAAFEELYARHRGAVHRVALQVCRNVGNAEEIVQQTFLALWTRAERLVEKTVRLRPWLTTVARNAAIDFMRADRPGDSIDAAEWIPASESQPDAAVVKTETSIAIATAVATLSVEQRAAVELVFFAGMTYGAAAVQLDEPIGTIKSRVRLALIHLRRRMAPAAE